MMRLDAMDGVIKHPPTSKISTSSGVFQTLFSDQLSNPFFHWGLEDFLGCFRIMAQLNADIIIIYLPHSGIKC